MFKSYKRIGETLRSICRTLHIGNESSLIIVKKFSDATDNKDNSNNKNNEKMEETAQQLITAGHYRKKSNLTNEKPEIIRILGKSQQTNSWKAMGGQLYSESDLMFNWEPLDTESPELKARKANLFKGLVSIEDAERLLAEKNGLSQQPEDKLINNEQNIQPIQVQVQEKEYFKPIINQQTQPKQFLVELFEKLGKNQEKHEIESTIKFSLGFNINKLRESIILLDLDTTEITSHIVTNILSPQYIKNVVSAAIINELTKINEIPKVVDIVKKEEQSIVYIKDEKIIEKIAPILIDKEVSAIEKKIRLALTNII